MDEDGYRSEELFNSPSNYDNDKELLAPDTSEGESEADDVDVNMTHLFYFNRKSSSSRGSKLTDRAILKKDSRDSGPKIITTPLTSKRKTSVTDLGKASEVQSETAVLSALKDMSSTLNQLVARVENTEQEMKTLKRAVHSYSSPISSSDATPRRRQQFLLVLE